MKSETITVKQSDRHIKRKGKQSNQDYMEWLKQRFDSNIYELDKAVKTFKEGQDERSKQSD